MNKVVSVDDVVLLLQKHEDCPINNCVKGNYFKCITNVYVELTKQENITLKDYKSKDNHCGGEI